jgi:hypothetical protein
MRKFNNLVDLSDDVKGRHVGNGTRAGPCGNGRRVKDKDGNDYNVFYHYRRCYG